MKNFKLQMRGFTLIELLITIAIISIAALIASSWYIPFSLKARRADGINAILAISLAEERYRSTNAQYGSLAQAYGGVSASPQGYYSLSVSNVSATSYTITATPQGNQANDLEGSISCNPLQLVASGGSVTKSPSACWPS